MSLPDEIAILPAHTNKPIPFDGNIVSASIGNVKKQVRLLQVGADEFIDSLLHKIPATPPNYQDIVERNLTGEFSDINPVELEVGANRCAIS